MILQNRGKTQVVYLPDIDAGHIVLGESMGLHLCSGDYGRNYRRFRL